MDGGDPAAKCAEYLKSATKPYEQLRSRHIADYQGLMRRFELTLPGAEPKVPTDEWLKHPDAKLAAGDGSAERLRAKFTTARFFMERLLPETGAHLARIQSGAASMMELPADEF